MLAAASEVPSPGFSVLFALLLFIAASVWLGTLAQKALDKKKFLEGFFLGNRGLGVWALALTATVQSGGTFMGYPSLVYSFGWIVLLWIGSYMIVPLTGFAVVGKRVAHLSRLTNAVTVPDLLRGRFDDPRVGLVSSLLIMTFLSFTMFAQFKAGATIMQHAWPNSGMLALSEDYGEPAEKAATAAQGHGEKAASEPTEWGSLVRAMFPNDRKYYVGLIVFTCAVVGYTLIGGFLASVWTDLFQSVMMVLGVVLLAALVIPQVGGMEQATRTAMQHTSPDIAFGPGYSPVKQQAGNETTGTASGDAVPQRDREYLTPRLALSMFFLWVFAGFVSPASLVRVMAAHNTDVMRKSIVVLSFYNCLIYIPLAMICIGARTLLPNLDKPDEVIPRLSLLVTQDFPWGTGPFVSGLILAAPFGAIMASVSCFVLVISSGLVQDIYVRYLNPRATEVQIRRVTTWSMVAVGLVAVCANLNPPKYLQALVVMSSSAGAAAFLTPVMMACYWRRATAAGMLAGMLVGFCVYFGIYSAGWAQNWATAATVKSSLHTMVLDWLGPDPMIGPGGMLRPYFVLGVDPILWGLLASAIAGIGTSLLTSPPSPELVKRFFDAPTSSTPPNPTA